MRVDSAIKELRLLSQAVGTASPSMVFKIHEVSSYNTPFKKCFRKEIPGPNASMKSGVYFITDLTNNILYIGKATTDNLAREIWGKFSTSTKDSIISNEEVAYFGNSSLAKWAPSLEYKKLIKEGNVYIHAVLIEPKEFSSLAEVYLHILCEREGGLPVLNNRIG